MGVQWPEWCSRLGNNALSTLVASAPLLPLAALTNSRASEQPGTVIQPYVAPVKTRNALGTIAGAFLAVFALPVKAIGCCGGVCWSIMSCGCCRGGRKPADVPTTGRKPASLQDPVNLHVDAAGVAGEGPTYTKLNYWELAKFNRPGLTAKD